MAGTEKKYDLPDGAEDSWAPVAATPAPGYRGPRQGPPGQAGRCIGPRGGKAGVGARNLHSLHWSGVCIAFVGQEPRAPASRDVARGVLQKPRPNGRPCSPLPRRGGWPARVARGRPLSLLCGPGKRWRRHVPASPAPRPISGSAIALGDPLSGACAASGLASLPLRCPPSIPAPTRESGTLTDSGLAATRGDLGGASHPTKPPDSKLQGHRVAIVVVVEGEKSCCATEASRGEGDEEAVVTPPPPPGPRGTPDAGASSVGGHARARGSAAPGSGRRLRRSPVPRPQPRSGRLSAPGLRCCQPAGPRGPAAARARWGPDRLTFKFGGSGVRGAEGGARRAAHAQDGLPVPPPTPRPRGLCSPARPGGAAERAARLGPGGARGAARRSNPEQGRRDASSPACS